MKNTFKLFLLYLGDVFSLTKMISNSKNTKNKVPKIIGITLLFLYIVIVFGAMIASTFYTVYHSLKPHDLQHIVLILGILSATIISFFFGFLTAVGNYVIKTTEENLMAMPLSAHTLFSAKVLLTYAQQFIFSFAIIILSSAIYGYNEHLLREPFFYISIIVTSICIPMVPTAISYLILVPLFNIGHSVQIKKILSFFSTLIMISIIVAFNFIYQEFMNNINNTEYIQNIFSNNNFTKTLNIISIYPIAQWFSKTITESNGIALLNLFYIVLTTILLFAIVILLCSKSYIKSITTFGENKIKKMDTNTVKNYLNTDIKSTSLFKTLVLRDIKNVFNEPTFFINGPLIIVVLPIIYLVVILASAEISLFELSTKIQNFIANLNMSSEETIFLASGILSLISVFLGTSTNIASTAFSREGKGFYNLKAMPISGKNIVKAKLYHASIYNIFTGVLVLCVLCFFFALTKNMFSVNQIILSSINVLCLSIGIGVLLNIIDMTLDLKKPKLDWDNPTAAFKQNFNSFLAIMITLALIITLLIVGGFLLPKNLKTLTICSVVVLVFIRLIYPQFVIWGSHKIRATE